MHGARDDGVDFAPQRHFGGGLDSRSGYPAGLLIVQPAPRSRLPAPDDADVGLDRFGERFFNDLGTDAPGIPERDREPGTGTVQRRTST
jgi:hypothetical protein